LHTLRRPADAAAFLFFVSDVVTEPPNAPCIWVDADACPSAIKDVLYRTARRVQIEVAVVANRSIYVPVSEWIHLITVTEGANIADDKIVEMLEPGDLVITGDIPLAARVVEKKGLALGHRGEIFDEQTVQNRLATRDLMEQFRSAGMDTGGPAPFGPKDVQLFANALDRIVTQLFRNKRS
jgi:uncharacterized protein YaiI (UPF0178 family)